MTCDKTECLGCQGFDLNAIIDNRILEHGYAIVSVVDEHPPYVYTVGLTEAFKHPELILAGHFEPAVVGSVVASAIAAIQAGQTLDATEVPEVIQLADGSAAPLGCRSVRAERLALLGKAQRRYGAQGFAAVQLILPDAAARLPWHPECDADWRQAQPVLY